MVVYNINDVHLEMFRSYNIITYKVTKQSNSQTFVLKIMKKSNTFLPVIQVC